MLADQIRNIKPIEWKRRPEVLLCAQTVKPMHGVVPRVILGKDWWDETRIAAYRSTDNHCVACGVNRYDAKEHKWLEGHELYTIDYRKGIMTYIETVPLCHYCHNFIHRGRLEALLKKGDVTQAKFAAVMEHGNDVLKMAGLVKIGYSGPVVDWHKWRLVLNGKKYPPLYKTFEDWCKAFGYPTPAKLIKLDPISLFLDQFNA